MNIFLRFILFLFIVSSLSGCATMIRGTSQDIPIKSDPSGGLMGYPKVLLLLLYLFQGGLMNL